ncbi:MAG TPA: beta-galactosidase GalB [Verrucomicrobiota bacterium]|nr:beta-galactosidase GalB [Verrucomicrobiota bacterium]
MSEAISAIAQDSPPRERVSFNADWRFTKDDPTGVGDSLSYTNIKPWVTASGADFAKNTPSLSRPEGNLGENVAYTKPDFDDSGWRKLNLPHDWGIEGPFKQEFPGETGKLPWWGVGWYRKQFLIPATDAGRRFVLEMDGAMSYANVWLNGQYVGGWPYGYASWQLDLTPHVKVGADNVLAIRLDNPTNSSRWYPGGGIYRNVWLTKTAPVHIAQWGVFVTTPQVSRDAATVQVKVDLENDSASSASVAVRTELFAFDSKAAKSKHPVAVLETDGVNIAAGSKTATRSSITIPNPKIWDIESPNLYVAVTTVLQNGKTVDRVETPFGIRTFEFTADNGFLLNGRRVPLQGVCNHHDLGALGAAFNVRAAERQLEIMKEMGVNAIRTAHNPPAPELLDLCDRMGFVVMDEAFDTWRARKKRNDYHVLFPDWHEKDLRALVRRDRNHPSVIFWSTGNEMPDQRNAIGVELSKQLTAIVKDEDPTRPVTAGCNHDIAGFNGFQNTVDVFGYNYKPQLYAKFRATNAAIPLISSESSSCVSSRGEYFFPVTDDKNQGRQDWQMSSYDLYTPGWAMPPDWEFRGQDTNTFVGGEFVWTGFDYLGEPTPYNDDLTVMLNYSDPVERARVEAELKELGKIRVPSRSSYFGIVDLAGFKKDRFYLYQARWRPELRMAHILPHWNWPERVGQVTPVFVYSSGDEAELFLNGKSLGRKKRGPLEYRFRWDDVVYQPGELKVVAYKNGKRWATNTMKTTGPATKLTLSPDRATIAADGQDLSFVTVTVADARGRLVPRSKNQIHFSIEGPGEIVATDNGDPTSFESFQSPERKAFNGLALVIVKATGPGKIRLTAKSDGLKSADVVVRAQ